MQFVSFRVLGAVGVVDDDTEMVLNLILPQWLCATYKQL